MKKNKEQKLIIDIRSAKSANDVYKEFANARYNRLTCAEQDVLFNLIVDKYFNDLHRFCDELECQDCEILGTLELHECKKPNIFKRIWNKLFKRNK